MLSFLSESRGFDPRYQVVNFDFLKVFFLIFTSIKVKQLIHFTNNSYQTRYKFHDKMIMQAHLNEDIVMLNLEKFFAGTSIRTHDRKTKNRYKILGMCEKERTKTEKASIC